MKLSISLLVLAALSQALSVPVTKRSEANAIEANTSDASTSVAKTEEAKSSVSKDSVAKDSTAKQQDQDETSKRELYEGNFGERNKGPVSSFEVIGMPPNNVFTKEMQEMVSEHTPAHQVFGVRLPQLTKISDVLSGHAPSFEAAVARQLYSPVSVYQTRLSSPTTLEVPTPAASQSAYSNAEAHRKQNTADNKQKLQVLPKSIELPRPPLALYKVKQPVHFDSNPQPLNSGLTRQYQNLPEELFRLHEEPGKQMPLLFPVYDQLGPFRRPGQVVPSQYLHQNGIFQFIPIGPNFGQGLQVGNRNQNFPVGNDQLKGERKQPINLPVRKQEYHAHPNGAISFARFTHNLPDSTQHAQPRPNSFRQPQPAQYQSQLPSQSQQQIQQQIPPSFKQNLAYPPMLQGIIEDLEHYQPIYEQQNQFNRIEQPKTINALQQQHPQHSSNLQIIQLQRVPSFNPQSLQTLQRITGRMPRPFGYHDQSQPQSENKDLSLGQASVQITSLPPLKPNYSKYVKPLEHPPPTLLPTSLQQLPTSTAKVEPVPDQLISSTTIQPDVKGQEGHNTQLIQEGTKTQSPTPEPKPEIIHQSQPTVSPSSVQSTTYLPFVTHEPQSIFFQNSTPQPTYPVRVSTIRPTPQKHDVVIQRQEIQEIFFGPPAQPPKTPPHGKLFAPYPEQELNQLRDQPHYQFFEQLLPYRQGMQDIHSPQEYIVEARHSQQNPSFAQQGRSRQYVIQQNSVPLQFQQFQPTLLQNQHHELEQAAQQQQESNQAQQHQRSLEQAQQRQEKAFELLQQQHQESGQQQQLAQQQAEQAQQRQEELEQVQHRQQAEQQQETLEQAQHRQQTELQQEVLEQAHQQQAELQQETLEQAQHQQQKAFEQAQQQQALEHQKQEVEQAQQLNQESEQVLKQQYQQNSLESNNQIQISTLTPLENDEKQTETTEIQQQTESQTEVQQDLGSQSTTGKPNKQPELTSNLEQPYLGPFLTAPLNPQIYAEQQLFPQPEQSPLLGVPSYTDVQYFGKFAQALFGPQN